jgi:hypothetical protein
MNTRESVAYGWTAFLVAGTFGSYIGYSSWAGQAGARAERHAENKRRQDAEVEKANAKLRAEKDKVELRRLVPQDKAAEASRRLADEHAARERESAAAAAAAAAISSTVTEAAAAAAQGAGGATAAK